MGVSDARPISRGAADSVWLTCEFAIGEDAAKDGCVRGVGVTQKLHEFAAGTTRRASGRATVVQQSRNRGGSKTKGKGKKEATRAEGRRPSFCALVPHLVFEIMTKNFSPRGDASASMWMPVMGEELPGM